jgi:uncharacterized lipoprotein YmbA
MILSLNDLNVFMLITAEKPKIADMVRQSQERNARLTLCEEHAYKMVQRTNDMEVNANENFLIAQKEQQQLKDMIRASIQQLVQYIFPIEPLPPIPRLDDSSVSDFLIIVMQLIPR